MKNILIAVFATALFTIPSFASSDILLSASQAVALTNKTYSDEYDKNKAICDGAMTHIINGIKKASLNKQYNAEIYFNDVSEYSKEGTLESNTYHTACPTDIIIHELLMKGYKVEKKNIVRNFYELNLSW